MYKFRKIIEKYDFPYHFKKIIVRYKKIGYNVDVLGQTACLVVNPIKVPGCLRSGLSRFNWWVSCAPDFQGCYFCESSCLFYLSFNSDFYVSEIMHL